MNWRPDWRDASAYPDELSDQQWRWEFLRRDSEYIADFERRYPDSYKERCTEYRNVPLPEGVESWEDHFKNRAAWPSTDGELGCQEKYGIAYLQAPSEPEPDAGLFLRPPPYGVTFASEEKFAELADDGVKLVSFDLTRPLAPQLKDAGRYLRVLQNELYGKPRATRDVRSKWPRYLRVLDAKAAGAKHFDIANELQLEPRADAEGYDPERLVSETLSQAQALQLRFKRIA